MSVSAGGRRPAVQARVEVDKRQILPLLGREVFCCATHVRHPIQLFVRAGVSVAQPAKTCLWPPRLWSARNEIDFDARALGQTRHANAGSRRPLVGRKVGGIDFVHGLEFAHIDDKDAR